ncbi:hypothetical protein [Actinopolyspora mortivallis]|uniref:Mce-associated membrane protein n=1 Tax=Actinopolyspora mortivallis TaxID=33906 RepID=A0A2T0GSE3_ACTMO|nr:hypothetical protein [Actinopolyspora mortivallis]PRW62020.1 hypothetical protein CEP50_17655 [Actinopolyspora mortivallis]
MNVPRRAARSRGDAPSRKPRVAGTRKRAPAREEEVDAREDGVSPAERDTAPEGERDTDIPERHRPDTETPTGTEDTGEPGDTAEEGTSAEHARDSSGREEPAGRVGEAVSAPSGTAEHPETDTRPAEDTATETTEDAAARPAEDDSGRRGWFSPSSRPTTVAGVLLVLALGVGGLAYWFHERAHSLRHEGPAANEALVDEAATSEVKGRISTAVEKLFSYDYSNVEKTDKAAEQFLTGEAVEQYDTMFETVREQAPEQKMVLTSTVTNAGVTLLQDDRAEVLLFVNQDATSTANGKSGVYPAQLTVRAEKRDGTWKITDMSQFSG